MIEINIDIKDCMFCDLLGHKQIVYLKKLKSDKLNPSERMFWRKIYSNDPIERKEIPEYYRKLTDCVYKYDKISKRSKRRYILKPELVKKFNILCKDL